MKYVIEMQFTSTTTNDENTPARKWVRCHGSKSGVRAAFTLVTYNPRPSVTTSVRSANTASEVKIRVTIETRFWHFLWLPFEVWPKGSGVVSEKRVFLG